MARATTTKPKTAAQPAPMADEGMPAGQAPVVHREGPKTVAQERKEKLEKVIGEIAHRSRDYLPFLETHGISWDVFAAIIKQALIKNTDLLGCSTASLLQAALFCAKDGLMPDGRDAAIVPFKTTAQYMPMYQGMLKIAYGVRDGTGAMVFRDVNAEVIYEGEEEYFEYIAGTEPKVAFRPRLDRNTDKPIVGAFSVIRTNNGGVYVEVVPQMELRKIAAVGKAGGPRKSWPGEFAKKDALRRNLKTAPKDDRLRQVIAHDEEQYEEIEHPVGESADIPEDALFEDSAHQVSDQRQPEDEPKGESDALARARGDLMAAETEAHLDEVVAAIKKATKAFTAAEITALCDAAEQLRAQRFPAQSHEADLEDGEEVAGEIQAEIAADAELSQEGAGFQRVDEALEEHHAEARPTPPAEPTATETAPPAESAPATSATAEDASTAGPATAADPSPPASSNSPAPSSPASGEWRQAPPERRVTPQEALLEDWGAVYFVEGIAPNGHGQVPMFNRDGEIAGWAKPDLNIPTEKAVVGGPVIVQADVVAAAQPDAKTAPIPQPEPEPALDAQPEPAIRATPEDRVAPEDEGYGGDEPAAAAPVYRLKVHPEKPIKEYVDATQWKDEVLYKISVLNATAGPRWWADNKAFVEEALATAKAQAGRIIVVAVSRGFPGAKELVEQHGPFA